MKLTITSITGAVLFFAWVSACESESSVGNPGNMAGAGEAGQPAGGSSSTAGAETAGTPSAGSMSAAGETAGGAAGSACELAATWQIVDDYAYPAATRTNAVGVTADSAGNVYVFGLALGVVMPRGHARRSVDGGQTWTDMDWDEALLPNDAAADAAGNVFVTSGDVFRSTNQGESFESVHHIPVVASGQNDPCSTGFVAAAGGVVVAGGSCDSTGWVVSKSEDGGDSWDTAFSFQLAPGKAARIQDVGVGSDGTAYATGSAVDANDTVHWLTVREGDPKGVVSDDFQLLDGSEAQGRGFASSGTPMVAGFAADAAGYHGLVRQMTGPDTWKTIDTFGTQGIDVEAVGEHLIATGQIEDADGIRVVTRRSDDAGASWDPLDEFRYAPTRDTLPGKLGSDPAGSFYSLNGGHDKNDVPHWVVRKLACE